MKRLCVICLAVILIMTCCVLPVLAASSASKVVEPGSGSAAKEPCWPVYCPHCHKGFDTHGMLAPGVFRCPYCGTIFHVDYDPCPDPVPVPPVTGSSK